MGYRIGIDVGGTFTDIVLYDEGTEEIVIDKVPSTPASANIGVIRGIKKMISENNIKPGDLSSVIHGTTIATNALLEAKGTACALMTTAGFKDILYIARQDRPRLYDFSVKRQRPFIPRELIFEVGERILHDGTVYRPLDKVKAVQVIRQIKDMGITSIAVCLLHSYVNPVHEEQLRDLIGTYHPEAFTCLSSDILPEFKEYERMSTTAINAYVVPLVKKYLDLLSHDMEKTGIASRLYIMASNGGIMTSGLAGEKSAHLIKSGPAAGVIGANKLARQAGQDNIISIDMGGTSFDISLVSRNNIRLSSEVTEINGFPLKIPTIDIHTIGSGGGSIAWIDEGGALKVGPGSAGAEPGPACYGRGGTCPTVTDANLVLGRLGRGLTLGGDIRLDHGLAQRAVSENIAGPLGLGLEAAAEGIIDVVNANMVKGIRHVSVEKGYDPREFCLVTYGGSGPLHACQLAREMKISKVMVPLTPGVASALGLIMADFRQDYSQTLIRELKKVKTDEINSILGQMISSGTGQLIKEGVDEKEIRAQASMDLRYHGQGYELNLELGKVPLDEKSMKEIGPAFDGLHEKTYGFSREEELELVNVRVSVFGKKAVSNIKYRRDNRSAGKPPGKRSRDVFINGRFVNADVYERDRLYAGFETRGPAVIEQKDSTVFIQDDNILAVDGMGNLVISFCR